MAARSVSAAHRTAPLPRAARLLASFLLAVVGAAGLMLAGAAPAVAATEQIDSFDIKYTVRPSGVIRVQETISYRFGNSQQHGIERTLVTREPYETPGSDQEKQDAVYDISNVVVTSPDPVATQFTRITREARQGREEQLTIRIGSPNRTVNTDQATYVIAYDLGGALRTSGTYDEFYWDATGLDWKVPIRRVDISANVPGGAQDTTCTYGAAQSTTTCTQEIVGGAARFSQTDLAAGEGVTIGVKVKPGLITDNRPHLEPDGSALSPAAKVGLAAAGVGAAASLIAAPLLGVMWWRRNGRDRRYAGLAPGTVPAPGQPFEVVANDPDIEIPVSFSPPKIPVAEAGLLVDGQVDTRETAATIIDLAVRGALTVQSSGEQEFVVTLVDPNRAAAPHEMVLLNSIFGGQPVGTSVDLSVPGSLQPAHDAMRDSVISQVASRGWFTKVPSKAATRSLGFGSILVLGFILFQVGAALLLVLVPLLPIVITIVVLKVKMRRGQRTADGRAVCDQVEGFRTYLATAEADQLRFEEGEDIFSRYLPWAIAFELADRWASVCRDLVALGRLPDQTPYWYYGPYSMSSFNTGFLTGSLISAAGPPPAPASDSSGTGFGGGGSSFSGGGFSGGGGGGGGGGSW